MSWVDLEAALIERLRDQLGEAVKTVMSMAEFEQAEKLTQFAPLVAVVSLGYSPVQTPGSNFGAKVQQVEYPFYVVAVTRSALETGTSKGARAASSPIVDTAMRSLIGWRSPLADYTPIQLSAAPGPVFPEPGLAVYPIAFTTRRVVRGID